MFTLTYPWWEMIIRALLIFIFLHVLFRIMGKKQLGEMNPLDFVLLLIVSESVSGGLVGEEHSVTGAVLAATTLIGVSFVLEKVISKSPKLEELVEGKTQYIIKKGKVLESVLKSENINMNDLKSALRHQNISSISEVEYAMLETNGDITVIKKKD